MSATTIINKCEKCGRCAESYSPLSKGQTETTIHYESNNGLYKHYDSRPPSWGRDWVRVESSITTGVFHINGCQSGILNYIETHI